MRQHNWAAFSGVQVASAFELEADGLGAISKSPIFSRILQYFADYEGHLLKLSQDSARKAKIRGLLQIGGTIETSALTPELAEIFCVAQVAVCCELFKGWRIPRAQLNREGIRRLAQQGAVHIKDIPAIPPETPPSQYSEAQRRLLSAINIIQNLDTIRVVQVVRLLGLIDARSDSIHQLSLAAGNGYRDLYGLHGAPSITVQSDSRGEAFNFDIIDRQAAHTVLVDNDPAYAEHYASLNRERGDRVLALNTDLYQAMDEVIGRQQRGLASRNLVVGLRIDHHMIPDAGEFLSKLARIIDRSSDLLLTIGAGNNLSEFKGRKKFFDDLCIALQGSGLDTVRIRMHGQGTLEQQRSRPNFGQLAYTSYEILYCRLIREKLDKGSDLL